MTRLVLEGALVLAGAGRMGGALLSGWLERGVDPAQVIVQDPSPPAEVRELLKVHGIEAQSALQPMVPPPAVLMVAVKPQVMDAVFPALAALAGPHTLVVSIAAGRKLSAFERHLVPGAAVIRAMPNTPAAVGRGMTVCVANTYVTPAQRTTCEALLGAVGEVAWIDNEAEMDAVTAVSGSGPAYVFLLTECLAEAAIEAGISEPLARKLARATVVGSGELLRRSADDPAVLRQNVTSPGGTTAAALSVLMGPGGLKELLAKAVAAAARRSRELGQ
ncbi:MAG TPA: pyrroline-5-carboxylate reductase [Hyphomicrobiaceae bacterium]|nr:pyrroline-5-carboxylate reductase [Hyphomicrobiaceae bacterium]